MNRSRSLPRLLFILHLGVLLLLPVSRSLELRRSSAKPQRLEVCSQYYNVAATKDGANTRCRTFPARLVGNAILSQLDMATPADRLVRLTPAEGARLGAAVGAAFARYGVGGVVGDGARLVETLFAAVESLGIDTVLPLPLRNDVAMAMVVTGYGRSLADWLLTQMADDECEPQRAGIEAELTRVFASAPPGVEPLNLAGDMPSLASLDNVLGAAAATPSTRGEFEQSAGALQTCLAVMRTRAFIRTSAWDDLDGTGRPEDFLTAPSFSKVYQWHTLHVNLELARGLRGFDDSDSGGEYSGSGDGDVNGGIGGNGGDTGTDFYVHDKSYGLGRSIFDVGAPGAACRHPGVHLPSMDTTCTDAFEASSATAANALTKAGPAHLYLDVIRRSLLNFVHEDWNQRVWSESFRGATDSLAQGPPMPWGFMWHATYGLSSTEERDMRPYHSSLSNGEIVAMETLLGRLVGLPTRGALPARGARGGARDKATFSTSSTAPTTAAAAHLPQPVPGDFLEAGTYRGGTAIYLRAFLAAHDQSLRGGGIPGNGGGNGGNREGNEGMGTRNNHAFARRRVFVADSFEGVPRPRQGFAAPSYLKVQDKKTGADLCASGWCEAGADPVAAWVDMYPLSQQIVRKNFAKYV